MVAISLSGKGRAYLEFRFLPPVEYRIGALRTYNLNEYNYNLLNTRLTYQYDTYRIASQSESDLLQSNNPFALAVLAGLYLIKSKKDENSAFQYKLKLMRILLEGKITNKKMQREYIQRLLIFIDQILKLPEDKNVALVQQLKPLIEKENFNHGTFIR